MKKRMFSRFNSIIQHAVEAIAPNLSLLDEFIHHWKGITSFFIDSKNDKRPVEETNIPYHLDQMLVILCEEENATESGVSGPCIEYLLQHKLLETLYSLGRTDHPPGMKHIVLTFFTKLLSRLKQPLLPHVNVHRAVQRLVKICGEIKASPSESEEIQFLCTVCAKIKTDPYLVNMFIDLPKDNICDNMKKSSSHKTKRQITSPEYSLINALLTLSNSADSRVAVKSCEGLILCASLPEQNAAACLVENTPFCLELSSRLRKLYNNLPTSLDPDSVETVEAKWGLDVSTQSEDSQTFIGKRQLVSFFSWLDYCDQLISVSNPLVASSLARAISDNFLKSTLEPALLQTSENGAILSTAYLSRCLRTVCSPQLLSEFITFILGNETEPETYPCASQSVSIRHRIMERCNHLSEMVCLSTLKLFDTLLQKGDKTVLHNLVLRNILGRSYYCGGISKNTSNSVSDHQGLPQDPLQRSPDENQYCSNLDGENKQCDKPESNSSGFECVGTEHKNSGGFDSPTENMKSDDCADIKSVEDESSVKEKDDKLLVSTDIDQETHVVSDETAKIVDCNMNENVNKTDLPGNMSSNSKCTCEVVRSQVNVKDGDGMDSSKLWKSDCTNCSNEVSPESSPHHSRTEVHKVVNCFLMLVPEEVKSSYQMADSGYDVYLRDAHKQFSSFEKACKPLGWPQEPDCDQDFATDKFFEGEFLKLLFDKLTRMLDQNYATNLQVTSIISKLTLVPHPNLHEFLLDPYLPVQEGVRTLTSVLQKVSNDVKARLKNDSDLFQKLIVIRKELVGLTPCIYRFRRLNEHIARFEDKSQLEAIIVFEEFCKELSAIAFVKHHAAVTR